MGNVPFSAVSLTAIVHMFLIGGNQGSEGRLTKEEVLSDELPAIVRGQNNLCQ